MPPPLHPTTVLRRHHREEWERERERKKHQRRQVRPGTVRRAPFPTSPLRKLTAMAGRPTSVSLDLYATLSNCNCREISRCRCASVYACVRSKVSACALFITNCSGLAPQARALFNVINPLLTSRIPPSTRFQQLQLVAGIAS